MKKFFLLVNVFVAVAPVAAQNVGIGTTAPNSKLEIHHRSTSANGLKLMDSATNLSGTLQFQNVNFSRGIRAAGFAANNFNSGQYLDIRTDSIIGATFKGNGFFGIRNVEPDFPLDVNGDINTTGAIRLNGNGGSNGQLLQSNGDGTMNWVDASAYKNVALFKFVGPGVWVVPAGVTKIWVEAWGAGGGGNSYAGGGAGGYVAGFFTVTPGSSLNYNIGDAGAGLGTTGGNGQTTNFTYGAITLTAGGGFGATYNATTKLVNPGSGGSYFSSSASFTSYFGAAGGDATIGTLSFMQSAGANFIEQAISGDGGNSAFYQKTGGIGGAVVFNLTTSTTIRSHNGGLARQPGGGGSGGFIPSNSATFLNGGDGGYGMLLIHY